MLAAILAGCSSSGTGAGPTAEQAEQDLKKVNNVGGPSAAPPSTGG